MKKILSVVLIFTVIFSAFSMNFVKAETLSEKLADTSDFSLSSIEYTEQMLIAYNIGNCFEMTELRSNYVRPEISNIDEHIRYKETMAGNVLVTEEYIKYLKSIGIQAIRLPVTWFNMLEDENGNIYPKNTWYADIETRRNAWYNGKINEEFLARIKQVVDWIIENDMYCMINTHHDAACNTSNAVNPIKLDEAYKEQTYNYLTNIWGQVGEYFKDYGSKLMFEFYNEATSNSGHMTANDAGDDFTSDLLCHLISLIRSQGSNNANRFLVCPRYGGVSMWSNNEYLHRFVNSDTADDKIVVTTHTYTSGSNMPSAIGGIRNWMNTTGIGAVIDEFGATDGGSNLKEKSINFFANIRKASDEYKVSCWFWDGGHQDCALTNRYYLKPSAPALGAYVGKDIEFEFYTQEEVLEFTKSTQPNWVKLYTENGSDYAGKYLLITSANKINNLYKSGNYAGYYSHDGAENGLLTYFTSDDGENYNLMSTNVPTPWTQIAWKQLQVSGSTYYTSQVDGNYQIEKIGDGLQTYVTTGMELIQTGGAWQKGHYSTSGVYEGEGSTYYNMRISLKNKIAVLPDNYYQFHLADNTTRYQFIIRSYDANGNFVKNLGTIVNGALQMPSNAYFISVSLYDSYQTENGEKLFSYLADGTFNPTMYLYVSSSTNPPPALPPISVKVDGTIIIPNVNGQFVLPESDDSGFVYYTDGTNTYNPGYVFENITESVELESVTLSFSMLSGASFRYNTPSGIRFYSDVDTDLIEKLRHDGASVELGTLIAPKDYLDDKELTFESGVFYACVPFESTEWHENGDFKGIIGSIVNIKECNLNREFVGRGYIKFTQDGVTKTIYANYDNDDIKNNSRSICCIANQVMIYNSDTLTVEHFDLVKNYADLYTGSDKYSSLDPDGEDIFE